MGIFDKHFKSTKVTYAPKSEQEAWLAIMYGCIAVDDEVADAELEKLTQTLVGKSLFGEYDISALFKTVLFTHTQIGSKQLIDNSVELVAPENKPTLFALTIELVLADGILADKEIELVEYLGSALDLEPGLVKKIEDVILILNKGNVVI